MTSVSQFIYLIKQELRAASRSRYIIISFMLLPLLMWGLEGGIFILTQTVTTSTSGETLYITNEDTSANVTLLSNFTLPFNYQGHAAGTNITQLNLSDYFIAAINHTAKNNNLSTLYGIKVIIDNYSHVNTSAQQGKVNYWLDIPANFSSSYSTIGIASVELHYLQSSITGPALFQTGISQILAQPPFTIVAVQKVAILGSTQILLGGEQPSQGFNFGAGFAGMIAILISVFAPAPFISSSFAGEREKKTMEALLALPIPRRNILIGKLSAGMVLVVIFTLMNIIGMFFYNYLLTNFTTTSNNSSTSVSDILSINLDPTSVIAISVTMFLSAFISIGIGISIASLTKDVRTSESMYNLLLMLPSLLVGMLGLYGGLPENQGEAGLLLYIIPWSHASAIFQEVSRPDYYNVKSLLGFGLVPDILFHLVVLIIMIVIILYIATKIFEREGIVN